jgi:hypothetical protein
MSLQKQHLDTLKKDVQHQANHIAILQSREVALQRQVAHLTQEVFALRMLLREAQQRAGALEALGGVPGEATLRHSWSAATTPGAPDEEEWCAWARPSRGPRADMLIKHAATAHEAVEALVRALEEE